MTEKLFVRIVDPSITIRCRDKRLKLKREAGGKAVFELFTMDIVTGPRNWQRFEVDTPEKFERLCAFLETL